MADEPLTKLVAALEAHGCRPRLRGTSGRARCPLHEDVKPSLGLKLTERGVLVTCFAGCAREAVLRAIGLSLSDVLVGQPSARRGRRRIEAVYVYRDDLDRPVAEKIRFEGKVFRWRLPTSSPTV